MNNEERFRCQVIINSLCSNDPEAEVEWIEDDQFYAVSLSNGVIVCIYVETWADSIPENKH